MPIPIKNELNMVTLGLIVDDNAVHLILFLRHLYQIRHTKVN